MVVHSVSALGTLVTLGDGVEVALPGADHRGLGGAVGIDVARLELLAEERLDGAQVHEALIDHHQSGRAGGQVAVGPGEDIFAVELIHKVEAVNTHLSAAVVSVEVEVVGQADGIGAALPRAVGSLYGRELTVVGDVDHLAVVLLDDSAVVGTVNQSYGLCGEREAEEVVERTGAGELQAVNARVGRLEIDGLRTREVVVEGPVAVHIATVVHHEHGRITAAERTHHAGHGVYLHVEGEYVALKGLQTRGNQLIFLGIGGSLPGLRSAVAAADHVHHAAAGLAHLPAGGLPPFRQGKRLGLVFHDVFGIEVLRPGLVADLVSPEGDVLGGTPHRR